jgi:hypothetical protein
VIVEMVPIVLGELYLPPLRGDEENVGGHKKKERYWETAGARKNIIVPQYDSFIGIDEIL